MKNLFHFGAPCTPPVVNGVTFKECLEHPGYFVAEVEDEIAKMFHGVKTFFSHPDEDPRKLIDEAADKVVAVAGDVADEVGRVKAAMQAEYDALKAKFDGIFGENAELKAQVVDLNAKVETLVAEGNALREQIAELEAEEEVADASDSLDELRTKVAALEAKKAAGQTDKAENMLLGRYQKQLAKLTAGN